MNLRHAKLRLYEKNGVWGLKDTWNMIICKLIINKYENISISVYWNDINAPGWKPPGWVSNAMHGRGEDRRLNEEKGDLQLLFFFCMSLHTSWYSALTISILCLNFKHLSMKQSALKTWLSQAPSGGLSSEYWQSVSWGLSTAASKYSSSGPMRTVNCLRSS